MGSVRHHPAPARLDPRHAREGELGGSGELLLGDGGDGDGGGVGLVDGYCGVGVESADLAVWSG